MRARPGFGPGLGPGLGPGSVVRIRASEGGGVACRAGAAGDGVARPPAEQRVAAAAADGLEQPPRPLCCPRARDTLLTLRDPRRVARLRVARDAVRPAAAVGWLRTAGRRLRAAAGRLRSAVARLWVIGDRGAREAPLRVVVRGGGVLELRRHRGRHGFGRCESHARRRPTVEHALHGRRFGRGGRTARAFLAHL